MRRLLIFLAALPLSQAQSLSIAQMAQDPPAAAQAPAAAANQTSKPAQETNPAAKDTKPPSPEAKAAAQDAKPASQEANPAPQDSKAPAQDPKPPDAQAAAPATAAQTPASPVPAAEIGITGWVEFGGRIRSGIGGNVDAYRSLVDLRTGFALLGTEFTMTDPKHRLFDDIHVRAYNWGDQPYSTFHIDARKSKLYDFVGEYREIELFDFLPSYADPLLAINGTILNQQSYDTRRRFAHFELNLHPGSWISPYVAYDWNDGSGTGVMTYVSNANQYPVPARLADRTAEFRGGVHFAARRFHATLEQGGTWYRSDQTIYQSSGTNYGDSFAPIFGQTLYLSDLLGAYGARGDGVYSRALVTANPFSWLDIYGQFLYSDPNSVVHYQEYAGGNLYLQSQVLFYNAQQYLVSSAARMPHTTGNIGLEQRPWRRLRLTETWITDRLHNAGSATQNQNILAPASVSEQLTTLLASTLVNNFSQVEGMLYFELTPRITLRGGYRYAWGDANDAVLPPAGLASSDHVTMRRNAGIGGVTYRPLKKVSLSAEGESGVTGGEYFRTSLWDYQKVRAQARYQPTATLSVAADFSLLDNQNPRVGVNLDYLMHQESLSLFWTPAQSKLFDFEGSYSRVDLRSNIDYLDPGTGRPLVSAYRDDEHVATALFHVKLPAAAGVAPQITGGGSFVISSGSRPTTYFQPMARFAIPAGKHFTWFAEWRYYGYGEAFYLYEGFRAHVATIGLRYSR